MKTTQKVIDNLKSKIVDRKLQMNDSYSEYIYKSAIKSTVNEMIGLEPEYLDTKNLPHVGQ
jgi:hypothetical protein